jgi:hypothetical protein
VWNSLHFGHVFLERLPQLQTALPPSDRFLRKIDEATRREGREGMGDRELTSLSFLDCL